MRRVIWTRLAAAVPVLFGVSLICFGLIQLAPGSFLDRLRLDPSIPQRTLDLLLTRYGLDRPWYEQFLSWMLGAFRGDLGYSLAFQRSVSNLLGESALYTLTLVLTAGAVASTGGLALSLLAAIRPGGVVDRVLSAAALAVVSVPTLVLAVGALGLAARTGLVPLGGGSAAGIKEVSLPAKAADFAHHLLLPAGVLSIAMIAVFFLQSRGALMEAVPSGFARAARSRGLSRVQVVFKHCLRTALVPVLTFAGSSVGRLLNGAFLVEVVTGWPGMGRLAWTALVARDSFLVLGILLLAATLMILGNLAADLAVAAADPRVRIEGS